jgi:hypothetical protein
VHVEKAVIGLGLKLKPCAPLRTSCVLNAGLLQDLGAPLKGRPVRLNGYTKRDSLKRLFSARVRVRSLFKQ